MAGAADPIDIETVVRGVYQEDVVTINIHRRRTRPGPGEASCAPAIDDLSACSESDSRGQRESVYFVIGTEVNAAASDDACIPLPRPSHQFVRPAAGIND